MPANHSRSEEQQEILLNVENEHSIMYSTEVGSIIVVYDTNITNEDHYQQQQQQVEQDGQEVSPHGQQRANDISEKNCSQSENNLKTEKDSDLQ